MIQASVTELAIGVAVAPAQDPVAVGAAQVQLGVEVQGPLGAVAADAVDAGGDGLVLEQVQLVDEQVVDAGLLEADAVVLGGGGEQAFELGLGSGHGGFELDQSAAAVVVEGLGELGAHLGEVGVGVVLVGVALAAGGARTRRVMTTASQSPVAARATKFLRPGRVVRSRVVMSTGPGGRAGAARGRTVRACGWGPRTRAGRPGRGGASPCRP